MLDAGFIDSPSGRLFCITRLPERTRGVPAVLIVPAFGDEMNKTRHMIAVASKMLSDRGIATIFPDLFGTGDSEGRFADASWSHWVTDLQTTSDWAASRDLKITGLIGIRTGALLAAQFAAQQEIEYEKTAFWQPVSTGSSTIKQILRTRVMSSAINDGLSESVDELLARALEGLPVQAGGYELPAGLVGPMLDLRLEDLVTDALGEISIIETTRIAGRTGHDSVTYGDHKAAVFHLLGEPYWNATEILCNTDVVTRTARFFGEGEQSAGI